MKKPKVPNALIGAAGVHYVVSELSRRGLIALPTTRNTAGYDVIVISQDGRRHANIQVKTSLQHAQFWLMPPSQKIMSGPHDYYICLRTGSNPESFEAFMINGREAKDVVEHSEMRQKNRGRRPQGIRPSLHVSGPNANADQSKSSRWAKRWKTWSL